MIGGGSWATALVKVLNENDHVVDWWIRNPKIVEHLLQKHHNPDYISSVNFSAELINPTGNLEEAISQSEIIFLAVPSAFLKSVTEKLSAIHFKDKLIVSAIKGMIPDENLLIAEYLEKYFDVEEENIVNISGPSHAEEVALEKLSYLTLACTNEANAQRACELLACQYMRCT